MLPATARVNDIVEVVNEDHEYYGMIGKIVGTSSDNKVIVSFYEQRVEVDKSDLKLKARVGTSTHNRLSVVIDERSVNNLLKEDYHELINFAIDIQDWDWAQKLIKRMDGV